VCCGSFPTQARLSSRGGSYPTYCVICGSNFEDSIHVLLKCPNAVQVWQAVNLLDKINRVLCQNYNMDAVIFTLLHKRPPNQSVLLATLMWSLWKRRNLKLWQQKNETVTQAVERATHLLEDWRAAQIIRGSCVEHSSHDQPNSSQVEHSSSQKNC